MSAAFGRRTGCVWALSGYWGMCAVAGVLTAVESGGRSGDRRGSLFRDCFECAPVAPGQRSQRFRRRVATGTRAFRFFSDYEDFNKFVVYPGDGHYIGASAHEAAIRGKVTALR